MRLVVSERARASLAAARDYDNHEHDGLGYEFVNEFLAATERFKHYPNEWMQLSKRTRRCLMHRFLYAVIFSLVKSTQEIQIIDLMHQKQKPRYSLS